MRFLAIVRTDEADPVTPIFDDAWDATVAEANPVGVRESLADALMASSTRWATVVAIDVDDRALLGHLQRPAPVLAGAVTAVGQAHAEPGAAPGSEPGTDDCVFCAITAGQAPATVVREWPDAIAIRPLGPVVDGHVIVLPQMHVADAGVDPGVTAAVMARAAELMGELPAANVITSRGAAATQTVPHLHVHLVPREDGDGLALPWTP